jgi:hypothetical protein
MDSLSIAVQVVVLLALAIWSAWMFVWTKVKEPHQTYQLDRNRNEILPEPQQGKALVMENHKNVFNQAMHQIVHGDLRINQYVTFKSWGTEFIVLMPDY